MTADLSEMAPRRWMLAQSPPARGTTTQASGARPPQRRRTRSGSRDMRRRALSRHAGRALRPRRTRTTCTRPRGCSIATRRRRRPRGPSRLHCLQSRLGWGTHLDPPRALQVDWARRGLRALVRGQTAAVLRPTGIRRVSRSTLRPYRSLAPANRSCLLPTEHRNHIYINILLRKSSVLYSSETGRKTLHIVFLDSIISFLFSLGEFTRCQAPLS